VVRLVIACLFGSLLLRPAFAQAPFPTIATDQNQTVNLPFPLSFGGEVDAVSIENGNLSINVPLVNIKGRGQTYNFGLRYSNAFWGAPSVTNPIWTVMGANYLPGPVLGWETNQPYATWNFQTSTCGTSGTENTTTGFIVTDSAGSKHTFPVLGQKLGIGCTQSGAGFSYENTSVPDAFPDGMVASTNSAGTALTMVSL
jgi:hypothetical protein